MGSRMNASMSSIVLIVLMIAFMYFFMIRPQQKQRKQHQAMVSRLKPGDEVVTIGRLHGVVHEVDLANRTVVLDCEGIYLTFDLSAVAKAAPAPEVAATKPAKEVTPQPESAAPATSDADQSVSESPASEPAAADSNAADQEATK